MKNTRLRGTLMRMLAVKELRLDGKGRHELSEGSAGYVRGEAAALRTALDRLELFDEVRFANIKERVLLDWDDEASALASEAAQ